MFGTNFFKLLTRISVKLCYNESMRTRPLYGRRISRLQKLIIAALSCAVIFLTAQVPWLAEYFYARGITRGLGFWISRITGIFSVSFYEITAVLLILAAVSLLVYFGVGLRKKEFARMLRVLYRLGMAVLCVLAMFGILYAPLYNRVSVYEALGLSANVNVGQEDVYAAAEYYVEQLNLLAGELSRDEKGNVVAPYSFEETANRINAEFDGYGNYFACYGIRPKAVALSVPMSYLGITGIYFPFYAEANVNTNIPSYVLPVTMAHEMTHAKGVSRENEANITAYVLCIRSQDVYLRYSGLMSAAAVTLNALPEEDFNTLYERLLPQIKQEYRNANEHYDKYEGIIDEISEFFNDLFLKANGVQDGTMSYGRTVESLVELYREQSGE